VPISGTQLPSAQTILEVWLASIGWQTSKFTQLAGRKTVLPVRWDRTEL
jgi:hypothetical protein